MAVYCTASDVDARLGAAGADARTDDDPPVSEDLLDEASALADEYLTRNHDMTNAGSNRWVKHAVANVAAVLYCERRGNPVPASLQAKFDRVMESLKAILAGGRSVPGLARKRTPAPTLSQPRIKLGPVPHTVIERGRGPRGRNPVDYSQRVDRTETPVDYT